MPRRPPVVFPNVDKFEGDPHAPRLTDLRTGGDYWTVEGVLYAAAIHKSRATATEKGSERHEREPAVLNKDPGLKSQSFIESHLCPTHFAFKLAY